MTIPQRRLKARSPILFYQWDAQGTQLSNGPLSPGGTVSTLEASMAKNTGKNHRVGAVKGRSQAFNPKTQRWTKRDTSTGQFMDQKSGTGTFKGVRREKTGSKK